MWSVADCVDVLYDVNWFACVETSLNPWNKPSQSWYMLFLNFLLDLVYRYFGNGIFLKVELRASFLPGIWITLSALGLQGFY
jgi:hypothetical protein